MLSFVKFQALGNDYILINLLEQIIPTVPFEKWVPKMCHRRFGIGSDGVLLVESSSIADFKMRMFNADGSESGMCGNGIRCFAQYLYEEGLTLKTSLCIETKAGLRYLELDVQGEEVRSIRVNMGKPRLKRYEIPMLGIAEEEVVEENFVLEGTTFSITGLSIGNPHLVLFVERLDCFPVEYWGHRFSADPRFPEGINVEFVEIHSRTFLSQRTWERGCGETYACGTGASAVCVAGILQGKLDSDVKIALKGGILDISWHPGEPVWLKGCSNRVFRGETNEFKFFEKKRSMAPIDCFSV